VDVGKLLVEVCTLEQRVVGEAKVLNEELLKGMFRGTLADVGYEGDDVLAALKEDVWVTALASVGSRGVVEVEERVGGATVVKFAVGGGGGGAGHGFPAQFA